MLKLQLGNNIEETNDQFDTDIFMWPLDKQCQNSLRLDLHNLLITSRVSDAVEVIESVRCVCVCVCVCLSVIQRSPG